MSSVKFSETLSNGVAFPLFGLGTWKLSGSPLGVSLDSIRNIPEYELIDTAAFYQNERQIGDFLKTLRNSAGKHPYFLTTKLWRDDANGEDATYEACLTSLQELQVDSIDLYLMHWPGTGDIPPSSPENRQRRLANWKGMERLYKEGKCRAIGVSNFRIKHLQQLKEDGVEIFPMVNQVELHPLCWEDGLFEYCKENNIRVQAYSSLGSGSRELLDHPVVRAISEELNVSTALVLLRWAFQHDIHVIPCSKNERHLRENARVFEISLSHRQMKRLDDLKTEERHFCWDPREVE